MVGKQLSALLQILRSNGVTRYQTPELSLQLGPAPARPGKVTQAIDLSPEALAEAEEDAADAEFERTGDFRFALERLQPKHFGRKLADPRRRPAKDHSKVPQ